MDWIMADKSLLMLLDDVRNKTLTDLRELDDVHARWAPPNLQNSCLWHAGHAYIVTEFLTARALEREPQLPEGWLKMFSWESNPAHIAPESWPPLETVTQALTEQHARFRELFSSLTPEQLDAPEPSNPNRTVRYGLIHGLHDEARHSGEIKLLRKLMQRTFIVGPEPRV
jgi:DinB superfamily